jgi:hypothetical protein
MGEHEENFIFEMGYNKGFKDGIKGSILKADYEARLKADMVAMLTDLHLKMEELGDDLDPTEDWDYGYKSGVEDMIQLLDERIDKLKGESDAQEQKKE